MGNGTVQIPPDSTGKLIDAASLDVGGSIVIRQRIVIADNSASSQFAAVSAGALQVSGTMTINQGTNNIGGVSLVAGSSNIGFIDSISRTVTTVVSNFLAGSGQAINPVDSANTALRVNVVAGAANGVSQVDNSSFTARAAPFVPIGGIFDDVASDPAEENKAATVRVTAQRAMHVNIRNSGGSENAQGAPLHVCLSSFKDNSGTAIQLIDSANSALRVMGQGTLGSIPIGGFIDASGSNRNVVDSANLSLRVTIANATATCVVAYANPPTINNISSTVVVTTSNPWVVNVPSVSHGPKMLQISTSATATLIAAPGAGLHTYITQLQVSNLGSVLTAAQVGWSGSAQQVCMAAAANGGGFVLQFDPPWKVNSNEAVTCRVNPNSSGDVYFNVNFFVST